MASADRLEELLVPLDPAAVFRWAMAFTGQAHRHRPARVGDQDLLDDDLVLPVVAHIIEIYESHVLAGDDVAQCHSVLAQDFAHARLGIRRAVAPIADDELVPMGTCPPHRLREHSVQSVEREQAGNLEAAPDGWLDFHEGDLELIYAVTLPGGLDFSEDADSPCRNLIQGHHTLPGTASELGDGEPC